MPTLVIKLPRDRDYCGELSLVGDGGARLAGPFEVAGRANTAAAIAARNPERSALLPFGDTPTGQYRLGKILRSGAGTGYNARHYGTHGILVLNGTGGEAALAEANGRFHVFLQGGATHKDGLLCSTNGALRLRNADLAALLAALQAAPGAVECWCVNDAAMPLGAAVYTGNKYHEGDPPIMPEVLQVEGQLSRRGILGAGAAFASLVVLPGIFIGGETVFAQPAMAAYGDGNGTDNDNGGGNNNNGNGTDNNNGAGNNNNGNGTDNGNGAVNNNNGNDNGTGNSNGSDNDRGTNNGNASPPNAY